MAITHNGIVGTDRQLYWLSKKKKMWLSYTYMRYDKITSVKPRFLQRLLDKSSNGGL